MANFMKNKMIKKDILNGCLTCDYITLGTTLSYCILKFCLLFYTIGICEAYFYVRKCF